jgi:hypothetical protein
VGNISGAGDPANTPGARVQPPSSRTILPGSKEKIGSAFEIFNNYLFADIYYRVRSILEKIKIKN